MSTSLHHTVHSFRRGILGKQPSNLMCFAVCAPLQSLLSFLGHQTVLVKGSVNNTEHYWLKLLDGRIIDPTADQFTTPVGDKMPKVYIGELPYWYKNE